ncbi:RNA methyltransferase [Aliishimia ponticola]|uniref:RNA methyltransferase n=2 Tax=Aliishimia ponticola TaxID=2499833 RepID=A0A4S4NHN1_9RHOB|nr:RNA methyltransferase [Aliishimia ponticola]
MGQGMTQNPGTILVRPQMGENIGAAARAMLNFGLDHMRIVAPRDGWPNPAAVAMASGAGRVLDAALLCDDLPAALGDFHFVFATTARPRDMTTPVYSPEAAMRLAAEKIAAGQRVGIMFGPERAGLENDDIARANAIITVPVNPEYPSLNLAQCVLLVGYEWRRATQEITAVEPSMPGTEPATAQEIAHLADHYEDRLEEAGFFFPAHKAQAMKLKLRNMWSSFPMTAQDVRMFHGMMRQLVRWKDSAD